LQGQQFSSKHGRLWSSSKQGRAEYMLKTTRPYTRPPVEQQEGSTISTASPAERVIEQYATRRLCSAVIWNEPCCPHRCELCSSRAPTAMMLHSAYADVFGCVVVQATLRLAAVWWLWWGASNTGNRLLLHQPVHCCSS
jgi:hypothetical protein